MRSWFVCSAHQSSLTLVSSLSDFSWHHQKNEPPSSVSNQIGTIRSRNYIDYCFSTFLVNFVLISGSIVWWGNFPRSNCSSICTVVLWNWMLNFGKGAIQGHSKNTFTGSGGSRNLPVSKKYRLVSSLIVRIWPKWLTEHAFYSDR